MGKVAKFPRKKDENEVNGKSQNPNKRKKPSITLKKGVIICLVGLVIAYFAFLAFDFGIKYVQLVQEKNELETEINQVKEETRKLEEKVDKLEDPDYLEILARRKFGYIREGDILLDNPEVFEE